MNILSNKKFWCIMGMFLYVSYVFRINVVFKYENIFAGVKFVGDPIFYAGILFLFGLVLFYMFMDTEKYVNGYGILHVTRNIKRCMIVGKIFFNHIKGLVQIIFSLFVIYFLEAKVLHMKETESDIRQFIYYIMVFYMVCLNLALWEAIFEIIFDARIAIMIEMVILVFHIFLGDLIYTCGKSKYLYLLCYSNLAMTGRSNKIALSKIVVLGVLTIYILVKIFLLFMIYNKKDIIQGNV